MCAYRLHHALAHIHPHPSDTCETYIHVHVCPHYTHSPTHTRAHVHTHTHTCACLHAVTDARKQLTGSHELRQPRTQQHWRKFCLDMATTHTGRVRGGRVETTKSIKHSTRYFQWTPETLPAHARTHMHAHAHTRTRTCMRTHAHARTHTRTHEPDKCTHAELTEQIPSLTYQGFRA